MNVCVIGTGHFACVVSVVLASQGHIVTLSDEVPRLRREDQILPDDEPGYLELRNKGLTTKHLVPALDSVDIYWIAYDVPLDARGAPVIDEVVRRIVGLDSRVPKEIPFLVSCQWPVGTTRKVSEQCPAREFVYVMENVRVGKAVADFRSQLSIVLGSAETLSPSVNALLAGLLMVTFYTTGPVVADPIQMLVGNRAHGFIKMTPESAELTKHATNAFMALQIAFVNEIASVASAVGAKPDEVSRGLMSDFRVSHNAPLRPGAPFGGGSLKRDLMVLETLTDSPIIHAIRKSNDSRT